ncbi:MULTISPECIES: hypothetical protein [unclassified Frankia]|uniref:hypothetical protein n=1 Tax=unclassified Frankia TaxID=2632575 RepID=UPI001EF4ED01|nr:MULTISPECIES: hypothetical protein [unclassified Frankia]
MVTRNRTRTRTYRGIFLGILLYLAIGLIVTFQDYWHIQDWDHHVFPSLLTAFVATALWPISLFYTFTLHRQ